MRKNYFLVFIAPIAILFAVSSFYIESKLENWMMEQTKTELFREAVTVGNVFKVTPIEKKIETLDPIIDKLAEKTPFRLTIIREDGVVLADSWVITQDLPDVKNHATRPELLTANIESGSTAIRHSDTVKTDMYYLAIPIAIEDFVGFIRVAIPLDTTEAYISELRTLFIGTAIIGMIILYIIILFATGYIDRINLRHSQSLERKIERRTKDISLLQTFGQMLTGCESIEEISAAILSSAPSIFKNTSGAISLTPPSLDHIEVIATWGEDWHPNKVYMPNDCWAFRKGAPHISDKNSLGFNCKHFTSEKPVFCVPFMANGVSLGAIHIMTDDDNFSERLKSMALTIAEHLSLSIANVKLRDSLKHQAVRDPLTNLYNRRYLDDALRRDIQRVKRQGTCLGVMMIDVDHFKAFNDTFGHEAGDYALQQVSIAISSSIRGEDIACRYGGEEFTVILPDADVSIIAKRSKEILEGVSSLNLEFRGKSLGHVTISIGVSISPQHGDDAEALISSADKALYAAKNAGRNQIKVASLPEDVEKIFNEGLSDNSAT